MAIQDEVDILKVQVVQFLTRAQIMALVGALGTTHTTLTAQLNALIARVDTLQATVQSQQEQINDHETRIDVLEA